MQSRQASIGMDGRRVLWVEAFGRLKLVNG